MAYGTNAPMGLVPRFMRNGSNWNDAVNTYSIASGYATSIFTNDPVTVLNDGTIGIGVAGSAILGVFRGCQYINTSGVPQFMPYWPASTTVFTGTTPVAFVADDPNIVFDVQETNGSGGAGTPLALADLNLNINFAVGTGSTSTGQSGASLNNTTEATTATLNMKLMALSPYPGNAVGNYANWLVMINNHLLKGGTGTAGV